MNALTVVQRILAVSVVAVVFTTLVPPTFVSAGLIGAYVFVSVVRVLIEYKDADVEVAP